MNSAGRQQRYRERRRNGVVVVRIAVDEGARLELEQRGYLAWEQMDDRLAIARAITATLETLLGSHA